MSKRIKGGQEIDKYLKFRTYFYLNQFKNFELKILTEVLFYTLLYKAFFGLVNQP